MTQSDPVSASRMPMRFLTLTVALTGVVLIWLAWATDRSYQITKLVNQRNSRIQQLRGTIVYLDEVLTMSARMAAVTGDPRWEQRYRQSEPKLAAAIHEAVELAAEPRAGSLAAQTDAANAKLVEMENRAFDLVRRNQLEDAQAVLFSDEYESQKGLYAAGIDKLADLLADTASAALRSEQQRAFWSITFVIAVASTLLAGWLVVLRTTHRWRGALVTTNRQLSEQARELAGRKRELDQKIE